MGGQKEKEMGVINDPLCQTHSPVRSDHYSHLKIVLFCVILKSEDKRTDVMCGNRDYYRLGLWSASWIIRNEMSTLFLTQCQKFFATEH